MVKVTILSDNEVAKKHMKAEWGFAALVETGKNAILFDTGATPVVLTDNMKELDISLSSVTEVFISHNHWDHVGGLQEILRQKNLRTYVPYNWEGTGTEKDIVRVKEAVEIHKSVYSTGTLGDIEQSLVIKTVKGTVIIAGCSHSGVKNILEAASVYGKPYALIGGLHDFNEFKALEPLKYVCATHCTKFRNEIKEMYPDKYLEGGSGRVIKIS